MDIRSFPLTYPWRIHSKTPDRCLKPDSTEPYIFYVFSYTYMYL